jgi:hypothetical protein
VLLWNQSVAKICVVTDEESVKLSVTSMLA